MIRSSMLCAAAALMMSACSSTTPGVIKGAEKKITSEEQQARQTMSEHNQLSRSSTAVRVIDELWVGGNAIQLTDRDVLPDFFNRPTTFYQLDPVSFQEIVSGLSAEFGTRIALSPDAIAHLRTLSEEGENSDEGMTQQNQSYGDEGSGIGEQIDLSGHGLAGSKVRFTLRHSGTVASLLDLVTNKANLFWRWDGTHISIYRTMTKTFIIDSLPGSSSFQANIETSSATGGSSHSTSMSAEPESHWTSLSNTIDSMISETGRFAISEQAGTLTVTDTPRTIEQIQAYVSEVNSMLDHKISIRTEIYEVMVDSSGSLGANLDMIFSGSRDFGVDLVSGAVDVAAGGMGLNIVRQSGRMSGSSALVSALSEFTDLSLVTSSSVYTTNGQPVPVQVVDETTYVQSRDQETSAEGGQSRVSITPGVVTSGVSMSLVPRVQSDGNIMLQVAMDLSQLNSIETFGDESSQVQLPRRSAKSFLQRVSVRSGETLMVSGFERTETSNDTRSMGGKGLWFLGGRNSGGERKVMTIIMITPYLMAR